MRIIPTTELHDPSERATRHDIGKPEDSYALFPTRADFEQAETFAEEVSKRNRGAYRDDPPAAEVRQKRFTPGVGDRGSNSVTINSLPLPPPQAFHTTLEVTLLSSSTRQKVVGDKFKTGVDNSRL
jgi:hypothetical protein